MCGRYILVQKIETIEKRFNAKAPQNIDYKPSYNITPGQYTPVITSENPREIKMLRFGMTPFWSKKNMMLVNARAEGNRNKENSPDYRGAKDIISKPAFRKPIRSQRCLVIADAFMEGTLQQKFDEPYLVFLRNKQRPFALAGIYDVWFDKKLGEEIRSFAIITTVANELIQQLPYDRQPVILRQNDEKYWLHSNTPLSDITAMLKPYQANKMNAYRISPEIKNPKNNHKELIQPIAKPVAEQDDVIVADKIKRQGMGRYKVKYRNEKD